MSTWKATRAYTCFDDCRMQGCPGHTLRVEIQTTADILSVYSDKEHLFSMDPTQWEKLMEILEDWDYSFFPTKPNTPLQTKTNQ